MGVTTAPALDKRSGLKDSNLLPVGIRVTYNRSPRIFPIGIYLSPKDFKKLSASNLGARLSSIRNQIRDEHKKAEEIIKSLGNAE